MAPTPQTFTPEETLNLIAERAKVLAEGGSPPVFDINVSRKNQQTGIPNQIASFSGATLEHITEPIRWLPMLAGGGEYILNVRHPSVQGRIGGVLIATFAKDGPGMESRAVNPAVTRLPNWVGPVYTGPFPEQVNMPPAGATAPSNGLQFTGGYGLPTGLGGAAVPAAPVDRERELTAQLADVKAALARTEAESRARAELAEERRQNETRLREVEQKADRDRRDLETRMAAQVAEVRAAQVPRADPAEGWQKLATIFMPIVQQMMTSQHETRLAMMKTSDENARRQIETSEKQHAAQMEMIRAITAKPAGMSEEMRLLIEQLRADKKDGGNDAAAAMMTRMVEAMGMVSKTSMGMIETIADIQMGDSEHPMVGAIREAVSAMKLLMSGTKEGAQRVVQKQLPQGQQPLTPQQAANLRAQQQQRAQHAANQRAAAAQAGRQTPQKPPTPQPAGPQPVPVMTFVPPVPAPQPPPAATHSHFQILRAGIEAFKPTEEVAEYFISLVKADEPSLSAELGKHGGSPFALLQAEFGQPFIFANKEYFAQLGETLDQKGIAAGLWEEEEDGDDDGGDDDNGEPEMVTVPDVPLEATIPLDAAPAAPVPESAAVVVAEAPK